MFSAFRKLFSRQSRIRRSLCPAPCSAIDSLEARELLTTVEFNLSDFDILGDPAVTEKVRQAYQEVRSINTGVGASLNYVATAGQTVSGIGTLVPINPVLEGVAVTVGNFNTVAGGIQAQDVNEIVNAMSSIDVSGVEQSLQGASDDLRVLNSQIADPIEPPTLLVYFAAAVSSAARSDISDTLDRAIEARESLLNALNSIGRVEEELRNYAEQLTQSRQTAQALVRQLGQIVEDVPPLGIILQPAIVEAILLEPRIISVQSKVSSMRSQLDPTAAQLNQRLIETDQLITGLRAALDIPLVESHWATSADVGAASDLYNLSFSGESFTHAGAEIQGRFKLGNLTITNNISQGGGGTSANIQFNVSRRVVLPLLGETTAMATASVAMSYNATTNTENNCGESRDFFSVSELGLNLHICETASRTFEVYGRYDSPLRIVGIEAIPDDTDPDPAVENTEFLLDVVQGEGSGLFSQGDLVTVSTVAPDGEEFVQWDSSVDLNVSLDDATLEFVMPDSNVTLEPIFQTIQEFASLNVENGMGSGMFTVGTEAPIIAQVLPGMEFVQWVGDVSTVRDVFAPHTFITIEADSVIQAVLQEADQHDTQANVIQGQTWHDSNRDGIRQPSEEGRNGVQILLLDVNEDVVSTAISMDIDLDGDGIPEPGAYRFDGLDEGTYFVRDVKQAGWKQSTPVDELAQNAYELNMNLNLRSTGNDFRDWGGLDERWIYSDDGWLFITPDGTLYDWNGGTDLAGSDVVGVFSPDYHADLTRLTDAMDPSAFSVDVQTSPDPIVLDFGHYNPSLLGGRKWEDANANGIHDEGEDWLNGWTIELVDASSGSVVATATTADTDLDGDGVITPGTERGVYRFYDLLPGDYLVREVIPDGWMQSSPDAAASNLAFQLNTDLGLERSANDFHNWGQQNERWLRGDAGWYFITPDGNLQQWDGSPRDALRGISIGQLDARYYSDLSLLTEATSTDMRYTITDDDIYTGVNFGNYRTDGLHGLTYLGTDSPSMTPGNVRAWWSGQNFYIHGDKADNQFALIRAASGDVALVGLHGTKINDSTAPTWIAEAAVEFPRNVYVNAMAGHDFVHIAGVSTANHLSVTLGIHDDAASVYDVSTGGSLTISGDSGYNKIRVQRVDVANNLHVSTGNHGDRMFISNTVVSNNTYIRLNGGTDFLSVADSIFHDNTRLNMGGNHDTLLIQEGNTLRRLGVINGASGTDALSLKGEVDHSTLRTFVRNFELDHVEASVIDEALALFADYGISPEN